MLASMRQVVMDASVGPEGVEALVRLLSATPVRIEQATAGLDATRLHRRTADEPWSVNDVLAHVRSAADVRERFIDAMATGEHATLRYVSPRSELRRTDYADRTFAENLAAFRTRRAGLLDRLAGLPLDGWSRGSLIHDRPETVASYVRSLTEHEALHCEQIEAMLL
jgi:hypothetical protein